MSSSKNVPVTQLDIKFDGAHPWRIGSSRPVAHTRLLIGGQRYYTQLVLRTILYAKYMVALRLGLALLSPFVMSRCITVHDKTSKPRPRFQVTCLALLQSHCRDYGRS